MFVWWLLLLGIFLVVHGVYEDKYQRLKKEVKVEYRFIPRSHYEEQLFENQFSSKLAPVFGQDDEWYHRNVGREMGVDRRKI